MVISIFCHRLIVVTRLPELLLKAVLGIVGVWGRYCILTCNATGAAHCFVAGALSAGELVKRGVKGSYTPPPP